MAGVTGRGWPEHVGLRISSDDDHRPRSHKLPDDISMPPIQHEPDRPPTPLGGASTWTAESFDPVAPCWRAALRDSEIVELEDTARRCLKSGLPLGTLQPTDAPLPTLGPRLGALREELVKGIGFGVLSGVPVERHERDMQAAMFLVAGAHIGRARSQNAAGHLLGHVRDTGANATDPATRIYQTAERQSFHTDSADVVGLLCLREAAKGGDSLVVSAAAIHDRLLATAPTLLARLFDRIATDRRGEVPPGANPWFDIPVFSWHDDRLTVMYQRQYIDSAQRHADAPRLDPEMVQALNAFDDAANDPELHVAMRLAAGDMQFVHNHSLLHDRSAFVDHEASDKRRHLLRLWLTVDGDRALPPVFTQRYGSITIGDRGGIVTGNTIPTLLLD